MSDVLGTSITFSDATERFNDSCDIDLDSSECSSSVIDNPDALCLFSEKSLANDSFYERIDESRYEKLEILGEGRYATVYRAKDLHQNSIVAIKHLRLLSQTETDHLGYNQTSRWNEAEILATLSHPNIIRLLDAFSVNQQHTLVIECMDFSLEDLIKDETIKDFNLGQVKYYICHILSGLAYLHSEKVVHRDLKPNNVLIRLDGEVKIADFGTSRRCSDHVGSESRSIVSAACSAPFACRFYRAPEILLGAKRYHCTVDVWAFGCVVLEFYTRKPFFVENCDINQIWKIFQVLGSPLPEDFEEANIAGLNLHLRHYPTRVFSDIVPNCPSLIARLAQNCLVYNPVKRCLAKDCFQFLNATDKDFPCCQPNELPVPVNFRRIISVPVNTPSKSENPPRKRRSIEVSGFSHMMEHRLNPNNSHHDLSLDSEDSPSSRKLLSPVCLRQVLRSTGARRKLF